jgi:16S rRNA (cytosine967-C5)-methyltransferase
VGLIKEGAERLELGNVKAEARDATKFYDDIPKATKILCDVPCSGYGVIRKKPEIRYKDIREFERLPEIQYKIAENSLRYLADGGELVYSTCTVRKAENEEVVRRLLENHPELELAELPEPLGSVFKGGMAAICATALEEVAAGLRRRERPLRRVRGSLNIRRNSSSA